MSDKKGSGILIVIINLLGVLASLAAGIFAIVRNPGNSFMIVTAVLTVLALLAALIYFLKGAKKNAAAFFKIFMSCYALAEFSSIISSSGLAVDQPAAVAVNAAIFALLILLAVGTDLGKTKSFLLCLGVIVLALASFVGALIMFPGVLRGGTPLGTVFALRSGANLCLALLTGAMVAAKYADKTRRGTT